MAWDRSVNPADDPAEGEIQDAVPPEWTRMLELEAAAERAERAKRRAEHQRRVSVISVIVPVLVVVGVLATLGVLSMSPPPGPVALPSAVQAFAKSLPESRVPNTAGVTVVNGDDAPNTWRVVWMTEDAAFCFAFVHQSEPAQTLCDAPRSVDTAKMRIVGELSDTGLDPPELFACGYTTGPAASSRSTTAQWSVRSPTWVLG